MQTSMESLSGKTITLIPILSKTKAEPFYGWAPFEAVIDRYDREKNKLIDTENREFDLTKYKIRNH